MKNLLLFALVLFQLNLNAQGRWNVGLQMGVTGNPSKFSSGMEDASALFTNNVYGAGQLAVNFRYRIAERWSFQTGFGFSEFGFEYTLAKDYSLLKSEDHFAYLRTGTCTSEIPALIIYNSKLNCRNFRFIAGAGFGFTAIDSKWQSETSVPVDQINAENNQPAEMTEHSHSLQSTSANFQWLIGVEKVWSRGNMLSLTFQSRYGFSNIASSTVSYMVENKNYTHTFTNNGTSCGIALCYYFLPMGTRKLNRVK
ncbi:MAG: outer membrane beta-barrel protein [Bacteroidia bacterium]